MPFWSPLSVMSLCVILRWKFKSDMKRMSKRLQKNGKRLQKNDKKIAKGWQKDCKSMAKRLQKYAKQIKILLSDFFVILLAAFCHPIARRYQISDPSLHHCICRPIAVLYCRITMPSYWRPSTVGSISRPIAVLLLSDHYAVLLPLISVHFVF